MSKQFFVYIISNQKNGTLYIGVTSDLPKRIYQHKNKLIPGFSSRYDLNRLVHFELFDDPISAISREKTLKRWLRSWKVELIEKDNPDWDDLYPQITD